MLTKSFIVILSIFALANCDSRLIYRFYRTSSIVDDYNFNNFAAILDNPSFSHSKETVIFHYNRGQTLATPQVHDVVTSYVANGRFNFIAIFYDDTNTISTGNANDLANGITTNLIQIFDRGYNSGLMNLLGFSLGAQIMARASRQVQSRSNRRHIINRLTGLDPLNLGPVSGITIGTLSSADAFWVESIHTEGISNGDHESRGHISFFVNGGNNQPGCTQTLPSSRAECNHVFALSVWAESVRARSPVFPSLWCASWPDFLGGRCNHHPIAYMGRSNNDITNVRGTFFLETNLVAPWSRELPRS